MKAKGLGLTAALVACLGLGPTAGAALPEIVHYKGEESFGPEVIADLPCLEGTEFTLTGGVRFSGTFVGSDDSVNWHLTRRFFGRLVPLTGEGPTYVESGSVEQFNVSFRAASAGTTIVQTRVNNDRFLGYLDGKLVASATVRIHEVEHFVGLDTDGDDIPDEFKVSVVIDDVSCAT